MCTDGLEVGCCDSVCKLLVNGEGLALISDNNLTSLGGLVVWALVQLCGQVHSLDNEGLATIKAKDGWVGDTCWVGYSCTVWVS